MASPGTNITVTTFATVNPIDDTVIESFGAAPYTQNSIGEKKYLELNCSLGTADFSVGTGQTIYFCPALFIQMYTAAPYGVPNPLPTYKWFITSTTPTAVQYVGTLLSSLGPPSHNRIRNLVVTLEVTGTTTFIVRMWFYMTQDLQSYLPNTAINKDRLLRSDISDVADLPVDPKPNSVYGTAANRGMGIWIRTIAALDGVTFTDEYQYEFSAGWYGKESGDVASVFTNPLWTNEVGTYTGLTSFSTIANNTFRVRVTAGGGLAITTMVMYLIRTDQSNDNITFDDNYSLLPLAVTLTNVGLNYFGEVTVLPANLVLGATYRMVFIAYSSTGQRVTSFITSPYIADSVIPWDGTGATVTSTWRDYHTDYPGGQINATIEERLRLYVNLTYGNGYTPYFANDVAARIGVVGANDIRRYLTNVRVQVYERRTDQAGVLYVTDRKDVVFDTTITRQLDGSYNTLNGVQFSGGLNNCYVQFDFRNRYEDNLQNLYTLYDDVLQPVPLSNQDWGNRTFFVLVTLDLYYHDAPTPFTDRLQIENKLYVRDYFTVGEFTLTPADGDACTSEDVCFVATLAMAGTDAYKLITTLELSPGTVGVIGENDTYDYGMLPQLSVAAFYDQEEDFGATVTNAANFCLDLTELAPGTYKIAAIAKRVTENDRITNDNITRVTNDLTTRFTNGN